eukprot:scaffold83273_cov45-Phaeocystis_antarctica.AAC.1
MRDRRYTFIILPYQDFVTDHTQRSSGPQTDRRRDGVCDMPLYTRERGSRQLLSTEPRELVALAAASTPQLHLHPNPTPTPTPGCTCRLRRWYRRSCGRMPSRLLRGCTHCSSRRPTPRRKQGPGGSRTSRTCRHSRAHGQGPRNHRTSCPCTRPTLREWYHRTGAEAARTAVEARARAAVEARAT